jgi:hypothetical protein
MMVEIIGLSVSICIPHFMQCMGLIRKFLLLMEMCCSMLAATSSFRTMKCQFISVMTCSSMLEKNGVHHTDGLSWALLGQALAFTSTPLELVPGMLWWWGTKGE